MSTKYSLKDILNKEQFKIKLSVAHYLLSGLNCSILILLYIIPVSFLVCCCLYLFFSIFAYRFIFSYTKNGKQYSPYLMRKIGLFLNKIRKKQ